MVRNLSEEASILGQYMAEIRDVNIQRDPIRFRANLERIAEILGYEVSKKMNYQRNRGRYTIREVNRIQAYG